MNLSKREALAGMAMQGFIAAAPRSEEKPLAKIAVKFADALLEELSRTSSPKQK